MPEEYITLVSLHLPSLHSILNTIFSFYCQRSYTCLRL
jgi:hypothetical protein